MHEIFITCPSGLETLLAQELEQLGIQKIRRGFCGVYAPKSLDYMYRINYCSRLAIRVLWPLATFSCRDAKALYEGARTIDWKLYMHPDKTFAIDSHVSHPLLRNSLHAAQVVKDALCDDLREQFGSRPSVEKMNPTVQFHLFIDKGRATISFDTSGLPLYKRGLREHSAVAPIQESLAAALLFATRYSADLIFCDPFCGSGTFLIEAAMVATNTPSGYFRPSFGFFHFPEFSETKWNQFKEDTNRKIIPLDKGKIFGADRDAQTTAICQNQIKRTHFSTIDVCNKSIKDYIPPHSPSFILCNPPYGKRIELSVDTYTDLGKFIKERSLVRCQAFFLAPVDRFPNINGFSLKKHLSLYNGGTKIDLYALR